MTALVLREDRDGVFAYKKLYTEQADLPLSAGLAHEVFNSAGVGADFAERVAEKFK
jgi:enoyl-CoA hydratase